MKDIISITHVAIRTKDEVVWSLPPPNRHHDVINLIYESIGDGKMVLGEQGFLVNSSEFVDRVDGLRIAKNANQLIRKTFPENELFSEDLW